MKRRWDVVTVGEIYIDHVFSGLTELAASRRRGLHSQLLARAGWGGCHHRLRHLACLGRRTAVFGVVGETDVPWIAAVLANSMWRQMA